MSRPSTSFYLTPLRRGWPGQAPALRLWTEALVDFQIKQRRTQGLTMGIERQRPRHPAAECCGHHEVQCGNVGQLIADNLAFDNTGEMRLHPRAGDLRQQQRIMYFVIGDYGDIRRVALVAGAGMGDLAQLCHSRHQIWTCGLATSRGSSTDATATTSRADLNAPPPA